MITYRDREETLRTAEGIKRLRSLAGAASWMDLLVEAGTLEQGVLDETGLSGDGWGPVQEAFRVLLIAASTAAFSPGHAGIRLLLEKIDALERLPLPESVQVRAPEGFAQYALFPAFYRDAALQYAAAAGSEKAGRALVVGVRSIGTSLSAVVAAALGDTRRVTVRPYGASGERTLRLGDELKWQMREWLRDGADVLVVDEGPGATGETFHAVGQALERLGVPSDKVVLLPSHTGGMALAPPERRAWFDAARTFPAAWTDGLADAAEGFGFQVVDDLSYGRWRSVLPGMADAPACAHHERQKVRAIDADGRAHTVRFAGLGRWGEAALRRAEALAERKAGPAPGGLTNGFLALPWISGSAPAERETTREDFRMSALRYVAARAALFSTGRSVDTPALLHLLEENAKEALGDNVPGLRETLCRIENLPERPAYVADARLARREWVAGPAGIHKVDALDHGDGTRFPGPTDAAWDFAGLAVEFGLDEVALLRAAPKALLSDGLAPALRAYRPVYAAACLGEAALSRRECRDPADVQHWRGEEDRYRRALERELETA